MLTPPAQTKLIQYDPILIHRVRHYKAKRIH